MSFHNFFGLSHHRHSGKRLPHKHTSYAGLAAIAVFAGLIPALMIQSAATADPPPVSDTVTVTANVNTTAPTITAPNNEQRFTNSLVIISGLCEPGLVVVIYKNDLTAGSGLCETGGTFNVEIDLFFGKNDLYARHHRPGPVGPASNHIVLYYDQFQVVSGASQIGQDRLNLEKTQASDKQLTIMSKESVKAQPFGEELVWEISVEGGEAPYALSWDWGDDKKSDLISLAKPGEYTAKHTYGAGGSYKITIHATDTNGQAAKLNLVAIATGLTIINRLERNLTVENDARGLWLALVSLPFLLIFFWLGEHYQKWRITLRQNHRGRYV